MRVSPAGAPEVRHSSQQACHQHWPFLHAGGTGKQSSSGKFRSESAAHKLKTLLTFGLPAFCDAGATTMLNIGLFYTCAIQCRTCVLACTHTFPS